jgi:hypothetical protein
MNCVEPEIAAVRYLWPRMVAGAAILLDDYCGGVAYLRQKGAFDLLAQEFGFRILALPTGQGLIKTRWREPMMSETKFAFTSAADSFWSANHLCDAIATCDLPRG